MEDVVEVDRARTRYVDEIPATAEMTLQQAVAASRDRVGWGLLVKSVAKSRIRPDSTMQVTKDHAGEVPLLFF